MIFLLAIGIMLIGAAVLFCSTLGAVVMGFAVFCAIGEREWVLLFKAAGLQAVFSLMFWCSVEVLEYGYNLI